MLTDPTAALNWFNTGSAPPGLPQSLGDLINLVKNSVGQMWQQIVKPMHSEAGDLCESASPFKPVPGDFASVPASPDGIDMDLAAYWSNAACCVRPH
jgi:hypothetical protein